MNSLATIQDLVSLPAALGDVVSVEQEGQGGLFRLISIDPNRLETQPNGGTVFGHRNQAGAAWQRLHDFGAAVNVAWFGALGKGGDDTDAVKGAFDHVMKLHRLLPKQGSLTRPKMMMPVLFFPPGMFRLTEGHVFTNRLPTSQLTGPVIRGAGETNSIILFDHPAGVDEEAYLFFNNGMYRDVQLEDLRFRAVNGTERFLFYRNERNRGNVQNLYMRKVTLENFSRGIDILGLGNADKNVFDRCTFKSRVKDNVLFSVKENSQAILHAFRDCVLISAGGTIFEFEAAGLLNVYGGSVNVEDGGTGLRVRRTVSEAFGPSAVFNSP